MSGELFLGFLRRNLRGFFSGVDRTENANGGAVKRRILTANGGEGKRAIFAGSALESGDHIGFGPAATHAMLSRIQSSGAQGGIVAVEISDGGGVKAGVVFLQSAAAERFAILSASAEFEDDRVAIPCAIASDIIRIETGGVQRAIPFPEQSRLQTRKGGAGQFIRSFCDRAPMQIVAFAFGLFDQRNDSQFRPARTLRNGGVIYSGFFEGFAIRAEMIRRRRKQGLLFSRKLRVRNPSIRAMKLAQLCDDFLLIPRHLASTMQCCYSFVMMLIDKVLREQHGKSHQVDATAII